MSFEKRSLRGKAWGRLRAISLTRKDRIDISADDTDQPTWYSMCASTSRSGTVANVLTSVNLVMETVISSAKCGMEVLVIAVVGIIVIAGLYQIVRDKIRESRQIDKVAQEPPPATEAGTKLPDTDSRRLV